ncbi:MAG: hypothetical protein ACREPR_26045 [Brasilonema sp.]
MSSVKALINKLERLNETLDGLQQEWRRRNDKVKQLRMALASEASAANKFQLEQKIQNEDLQLQTLEQKMQDVEKLIELVNVDLASRLRRTEEEEFRFRALQKLREIRFIELIRLYEKRSEIIVLENVGDALMELNIKIRILEDELEETSAIRLS